MFDFPVIDLSSIRVIVLDCDLWGLVHRTTVVGVRQTVVTQCAVLKNQGMYASLSGPPRVPSVWFRCG